MQVTLWKTPDTKVNKQQMRVPNNPQKGPTCWYYAARLIREFYGKTYSNLSDIPSHLVGARDVEQRISQIRKIQTIIDNLVGVEGLREMPLTTPSKLPKTFLDALHEATISMFPRASDWQDVLKRFLIQEISDDDFYEIFPPPPISKQFVTFISIQAPRLMLLELTDYEDSTVLIMYGFAELPLEPNLIVTALKNGALLLGSGDFSHANNAHIKVDTLQYQQSGQAIEAIDIYRVQNYETGGMQLS